MSQATRLNQQCLQSICEAALEQYGRNPSHFQDPLIQSELDSLCAEDRSYVRGWLGKADFDERNRKDKAKNHTWFQTLSYPVITFLAVTGALHLFGVIQ